MLQYEISMPSFYISSFAVSKNPRENHKRRGEKAAPLRHVQGQEHPRRMLPFQQGFSFHQKQTRLPCFQAAQKMPGNTVTSSRTPIQPQCPSLLQGETGPGACSTAEGPQDGCRQHHPSSFFHFPPLLPSPKRGGETLHRDSKAANLLLRTSSSPSPWCHK